MEREDSGEKEISVERMDEEEEEEMDQTTIIGSAPTPVIVSVSPNVDYEPEHHTSPRHSPISGQSVAGDQRLLVNRAHLQVRQTLSEPGRNARVYRPKVARLSPTRLSPIQPRKYDLSKTLSMGAALDTATSSGHVLWKPVESTGQRISPVAGTSLGVESMQQEGGGSDDSPSTTPSTSPRSMGGSSPVVSTAAGFRMPYLTQMPTQEQLEALYKHIPASQDQLELMQKQMLTFLEQQQKAAAALGLATSTATGGAAVGGASLGGASTVAAGPQSTEMFQFPLVFALSLPATGAPSPLTQIQTTSGTSSATPSPTPSNSSTDSGISGISLMSSFSGFPQTTALSTGAANLASRDTLSLNAHQRRPLSESLSAPGFQQQQQSASGVPTATGPDMSQQYESLLRQFNLQNQQLLLQGHHLQQHYIEQQQRLVQQALLERKQFEEQQRQLATMHLRQQQDLQKKQQVLKQMQEAQVLTLQRQQLLLYQQSLQQQQRFAQAQVQVQQQQQPSPHKPAVRRASARETVSLPYAKSALSAQGSNSSSGSLPEAAGGGGASEMSSLSIDQIRGSNRSPSLTPKASLTPTNSYESTASNNGRTSPHVGVASPSSGQEVHGGTGLVYDTMMLKHSCGCGGSHAEHPGRLQSIWARLHETRVIMNCKRLKARKASMAELQSIHSENHVRLYARPMQRKQGVEKKDSGRAFIQLSCGGLGVDRDTYWNEQHTSNTARMAAGSVIELADKVISGEVKNGFAFIRPPGHHALPNQAMAFCYFNNVALAAKAMLSKSKKVCVVDWDIHHGNGTQHIFYDNPGVLYISIHRYDNGTFFPGTGRPEEIGSGAGLGFNVNIAFSGTQNYQGMTVSNFGDAEYLAAFRSIVVPICREFDPDIILVSAGFNATEGHPPTLGGYSVTPKCYAAMTRMLMSVGAGRVAMALEGGYELMSLCASAEGCMRALLCYDLPQLDSSAVDRPPQAAAVASMEKTIAYHKNYWRCLIRSSSLLPLSHTEAEKREMEEADTVSALASLSVGGEPQHRSAAMQTAV